MHSDYGRKSDRAPSAPPSRRIPRAACRQVSADRPGIAGFPPSSGPPRSRRGSGSPIARPPAVRPIPKYPRKRRHRLARREVVERAILNTKRRRVAASRRSAKFGGAGEWQGMALHPGQHLVGLTDLPVPDGVTPVGQQGVGLVEYQERLFVARLPERLGDLPLGLPDPGRQEIGCPASARPPARAGRRGSGRMRFSPCPEARAGKARSGVPYHGSAGRRARTRIRIRPHEREIEPDRHPLNGASRSRAPGASPRRPRRTEIDIAAGEARGRR